MLSDVHRLSSCGSNWIIQGDALCPPKEPVSRESQAPASQTPEADPTQSLLLGPLSGNRFPLRGR